MKFIKSNNRRVEINSHLLFIEEVRILSHVSVQNLDVQMVEEIVGVLLVESTIEDTRIMGSAVLVHVAAHRETGRTDEQILLQTGEM